MEKTIKKNSSKKDISTSKKFDWSYSVLFAILALTVFLYIYVFKSNFLITWDDQKYITENASIKEISWVNFKNMFTSSYVNCYLPLTIITYAIEYSLFGLNPVPYHVFNLILHLLNVYLVFIFIQKLANKKEISIIVALVFAIHPMHVESVAWVSERKDVLYSFFFLCSLISYLNYLKKDFEWKYLIYCFLFFVLSLLSKPAAVPLPIVLILIDYYFSLNIFDKKRIFEKIPFLILSLIFGIVAYILQKDTGTIDVSPVYLWYDKFFLVSYSFIFYIIKLIFPFYLSAIYYFPNKINGLLPFEYYISPLIILLIILAIYKSGIHRKYLLFGFLFYLITIIMVIQFVPFGRAITADRYSYIPYIGLSFIIGYFFNYLTIKNKIKNILLIIGTGYILVFSFQTWNRNIIWLNGISLFNDVAEKYPEQPHIWAMLGSVNELEKNYDDAITSYNKSILLEEDSKVIFKCGQVKFLSNRFNEAIADFHHSIKIDSTYSLAYFYLAEAMDRTKQNYQEEIKNYDKAIKFNKSSSIDYMYNNRGVAKLDKGDNINALSDFDMAIKLKPTYAEAYNNRGLARLFLKDYENAIKDFNKCISISKDFPDAYLKRGVAKSELKDLNGACLDFHLAYDKGLQDAGGYINQYCK